MRETMTGKERYLAALKMQAVDRLPFWPKLDSAYARAQKGRFAGQNNDALYAWIGSDREQWVGNGLKGIRKHTSAHWSREGAIERCVIKTPHGTLTSARVFDEASQSTHPVEFPVKTHADLPAMLDWHQDVSYEMDSAELEKVRARCRRTGAEAVTVAPAGRSPLMEWLQHMAGIENGHYLLADYPAEVAALFEAMQRDLLAQFSLLLENHPADVLSLIENTSTTMISVSQYRELNLAHVEACAKLARQHNRTMVIHMCGHLKALLPDLARLPVAGFEAFTAPPLGNTTLADGRQACPDKCLIGGTFAMLWLKSPAQIIAWLDEQLGRLPHHRGLVLTTGGVAPPACPPETFKAVCEWVKAYKGANFGF